MSQYPEPTVGAIIINPQQEIFLFQSHKWNDLWAIPGGHIELGESADSAVRREVKEETGLEVSETQFLCYQECLYDPAFYQQKHFVFLDFVCQTPGGDVVLNDEAEAWAWVMPEKLSDYDIEPFSLKTLRFYLEQAKDQ